MSCFGVELISGSIFFQDEIEEIGQGCVSEKLTICAVKTSLVGWRIV